MRDRSSSRRGSDGGTVLEIAESFSERPLDSTGLTGYSAGPAGRRVRRADRPMRASTTARETRSDGDITLSRTLSRRTRPRRCRSRIRAPGATGWTPAGSQIGSVRLERRVSPSTDLPRGLRLRIGLVRHGGVRGRPSGTTSTSASTFPGRFRFPAGRCSRRKPARRCSATAESRRLRLVLRASLVARPRGASGPRKSSTRGRCSSWPVFRSRSCRTRLA